MTETLNETVSTPASQTIGSKRSFDLFRLHPIPITEAYLAVDIASPFHLFPYYQSLPTVHIDHLGLPESIGAVPRKLESQFGPWKDEAHS